MASTRRSALTIALLLTMFASACATPIVFGANGLPQPAFAPGGSGSAGAASVPGAGAIVSPPKRCEQPAGSAPFAATSPESVDIGSDAVRAAIGDPAMFTASSIRIYRHDCLIGESGKDPQTEAVPQELWSATKSVLSMLVGIAVTRGQISLDDTVAKYIPNVDEAHGALTLRQLMTHTSGLSFAWANEIAALSGDSVAYAMSLPFVHPPGTFFEYAQTTLEVVGAMVEKAVGRDLQDFAQDVLFSPLGIARDHWHWQRDGAGHSLGFAGLSFPSMDLARLASLLLHGGDWRGTRIISAEYVDQMGEPGPANGGYGLLTWTNRGTDYYSPSALVRHHVEHPWIVGAPADLFGMSGLFDQEIWMIPSLDMVVIRTGGPELPAGWKHAFVSRLFAGLQDVHLPDPGPLPHDLDVDLSDFSRLIDLATWPHSA